MISSKTPFIQQEFFDFLEHATHTSVQDQVIFRRDFDHDVFWCESRHRGGDHQSLVCPINLNRDTLFFQLLLHALYLSLSVMIVPNKGCYLYSKAQMQAQAGMNAVGKM